MERGDVVVYDVTGQRGMRHWEYLNGRIGVVTSSAKPHPMKKIWRVGYSVRWITDHQLIPKEEEDHAGECYPVEFLRVIGHIDLDAA